MGPGGRWSCWSRQASVMRSPSWSGCWRAGRSSAAGPMGVRGGGRGGGRPSWSGTRATRSPALGRLLRRRGVRAVIPPSPTSPACPASTGRPTAAQPGRAQRGAAQALPPSRHPLRQARRQLPGLGRLGRRPHLAMTLCGHALVCATDGAWRWHGPMPTPRGKYGSLGPSRGRVADRYGVSRQALTAGSAATPPAAPRTLPGEG
jgi:hypothetical protein